MSTPGGRAQAEKFLKTETSKIPDIALRAEYENEYNSRKFNQWHKWSRKQQSAQVAVPEIDAITRNTLIFITNKFPEIAERHAEFLSKLNISLDGDAPDMNMDARGAERYITSLKLQNYLKKLQEQKQKLTTDILRGDADDDARGQISAIDSEITKYTEKLEQMISD